MKENIVYFLNLFLLNSSGFVVVLIKSFFAPFISILDLVKYVFKNKHNKKRYGVFSLSVKELMVSLVTLILFFFFCYFCKRFWYLFFTLPILLGLLETIRRLILKKQRTFISRILDIPSCGTPFVKREEESYPKETPIQDNGERLSYEESEKLYNDLMGL